MSSSSSSSSPSSSSIGEKRNKTSPRTGILFGFQQLEERSITNTTCSHTTQLPVLPSIIDIIGCDITIDDIQQAKQEMIKQGIDLKIDVNENQNVPSCYGVTPLIHFCLTGNLLIVKLLFLIDANCTKLSRNGCWFPMLAAAEGGHLDICRWLFEYGGEAKYQINKEINRGRLTPLRQSYLVWRHGRDNEGKTCRWLLRNGGGQHLSRRALQYLEISNSKNRLVMWMRENIQLHDTFILFLCGATTMITLSLSSEPNDGCIRKHKHKQKIHPERSLQILDGHPGIMELCGDYVGLIRGKEIRMLKEFNKSVIEYNAD